MLNYKKVETTETLAHYRLIQIIWPEVFYISDRGSASRLYASDIPVSRANQKGNQSRRPV